jgi:hypothetical protein
MPDCSAVNLVLDLGFSVYRRLASPLPQRGRQVTLAHTVLSVG